MVLTDEDPDLIMIDILYEALTNDTALQAIFGDTVWVYNIHAGEEPDLPYFVHRLQSSRSEVGFREATYYLDWYTWTTNDNDDPINDVTEAYQIKSAVFKLLENSRFRRSEVGTTRIQNDTCNPVPDSTKGITHISSMWGFKYGQREVIEAINAR